MKSRFLSPLLKASLIAAGLSAILAATMSLIDWRENPTGIFRNDEGTNWNFVWDTFQSWFWPSLIGLAPVLSAASLLYKAALKAKPSRPEKN